MRTSTLALAFLFLAGCGGGKATSAPTPAEPVTVAPAAEAPAEPAPKVELAKNLQVLPKDMPLEQIEMIMETGVAPSLGVKCSFCHEGKDFASDANPKKEVARDMMRMTMAVSQSYFAGEFKVSCFTCHKGKAEPEVMGKVDAKPAAPGAK